MIYRQRRGVQDPASNPSTNFILKEATTNAGEENPMTRRISGLAIVLALVVVAPSAVHAQWSYYGCGDSGGIFGGGCHPIDGCYGELANHEGCEVFCYAILGGNEIMQIGHGDCPEVP